MSDVSPRLRVFVAACKSVSRPTEADMQRVRAALQLRLGAAALTTQAAATSNTARLLFGKVSAMGFAGLMVLGSFWFFAARSHRAASSESNAAPSAAATIKVALRYRLFGARVAAVPPVDVPPTGGPS